MFFYVFSFAVAFPVAHLDLFKCKVHYKLNILSLLLLLLVAVVVVVVVVVVLFLFWNHKTTLLAK